MWNLLTSIWPERREGEGTEREKENEFHLFLLFFPHTTSSEIPQKLCLVSFSIIHFMGLDENKNNIKNLSQRNIMWTIMEESLFVPKYFILWCL